MEIEFARQIFDKYNQIPNFMNIRPVEDEFRADGQTDG
jgi:hypothetical protein